MILRVLLVVSCLAAAVQAEPPHPGDPWSLVDLRGLARPAAGERFVIDTLSGRDKPKKVGDRFVIADIAGPGVVDNLWCGDVKEIALWLDGRQVLRCNPHKDWPRVYPPPKPNDRGRLPFAFPMVQTAAQYAHCVLPLPFRERVRVTATARRTPGVWLAGRRLPSPPKMTFSADPGSDYVKSLSRAHQWLAKSLSVLPDLAGSREFRTQAHCAAGEQAELVELQGPAEVVGMRLRVLPGAEELLRYQVIEITIDGVASVRMPLVDLVGVSHPWPHAWFPMAGDWAAGIVHPYYHGGGRREPAVAAYFKLPIPFARKLRIDVRNRSSQLPVTFDCLLRVMPLDDVDHAARLCGTSQRLDLPAQGEATLFDAPAPGRVIGLSMFTTGHGRDWDWRRKSRLELTDANGVIARGAGLLPLAMQGASGNICFGSLCWNHNSLEPQGRCGAGRHFWLDPLPLRAGGQLRYLAAGRDGPTRAEVAVLWYQPHSEEPFRAPEVSADIEPLPPPTHGQPGKPAPGGWAAEAEAFAATAEATCGTARAATAGAKDAFASGGAYLAWNAECPGDALDLLAPMPPTHYVRLWLHRLLFPAGGVFSVALAAPGDTGPRLARAKTDADFRARRLGLARGRAVVDYYDFWPHRQAYRHEMPIMRNQAPGRLGRIRFICVTKRLESRGYLLAVDQLGLDPSPASPPGWHEFEAAAVIGSDAGAEAQPMAEGRADFFGWGGLDIDAAEPSRVDIALVHPLAGPPAAAVELRGIAESGEWSIALDGAARLRVSATKEAKGPSTWRLTFTQPRSLPMSLTLSARCESRRGRLLLDAWQFDSMRP